MIFKQSLFKARSSKLRRHLIFFDLGVGIRFSESLLVIWYASGGDNSIRTTSTASPMATPILEDRRSSSTHLSSLRFVSFFPSLFGYSGSWGGARCGGGEAPPALL